MDNPRTIAPRERLAALADDGRFAEHDAVVPSPHLARFGIAAQDDDGVVAATLAIDGRAFEVVAQDARFLGGSAGERHAAKIAAAIGRARATGRPLLILAASGGVRLHEANAAELALARALRALCDARAAGLATFALGVGDVFGGMSVMAAACGALALTPHARFGLSGPRVIAQARGPGEVDPQDHAAIDALFGAAARARDGIATLVADDPDAVRAWLRASGGVAAPFADDLARVQARLLRDAPGDASAIIIAVRGAHATLPAFDREVDAARVVAADAVLLALPRVVDTLVIVEDSRGHEASAGAERVALSRFLAHHALVLAALRARGVTIVGVVTGVGHSAAFFANALQADRLYALPASRIVAMEAQALARVIGMDAGLIARAVEDDPLLGHPARHFAALGGLALVDAVSDAR
ncbi:MAG TPA: carboxyl transferase domain-containing protein [Casimicrobiaceae bacterium]